MKSEVGDLQVLSHGNRYARDHCARIDNRPSSLPFSVADIRIGRRAEVLSENA